MNFIANESPEKLRGGYYTDPDIANFLSKWVLAINPSYILEPSCGDGAFLDSIGQINASSVRQIVAFEIEAAEAAKAILRAHLTDAAVTVVHADYIDWGLSSLDQLSLSTRWDDEIPILFDAILGNPPYIRYQYLSDEQQRSMQKLFDHFKLRFTKHTNLWVAFLVLSLAHLRPEGRLAMVVPAEILHVLHAQSLRDFLNAQCSKILIIDPEDLWFSNALQGVVLLLAEKKSTPTDKGSGIAISPLSQRSILKEDPEQLFQKARFVNGDVSSGKWMPALLSQSERDLLADISERQSVYRFHQLATVDVGIVTGANEFFLVPDEIVSEYELQEWAHPMFGRSEHARGIIYDEASHEENRRAGVPTNFLWFPATELGQLPDKTRRYLERGVESGLIHRYKCRMRSPWYQVPSVSSSPVAMLKRAHDYPRLILNKISAYTTDTAYRIHPVKVSAQSLVYSFINSLTALSAELEGRHYGGGVLELVPSEIERLLVPVVAVSELQLTKLHEDIRAAELRTGILEKQDGSILKPLGVNQSEREMISSAWFRLRNRRQRNKVGAKINKGSENGG